MQPTFTKECGRVRPRIGWRVIVSNFYSFSMDHWKLIPPKFYKSYGKIKIALLVFLKLCSLRKHSHLRILYIILQNNKSVFFSQTLANTKLKFWIHLPKTNGSNYYFSQMFIIGLPLDSVVIDLRLTIGKHCAISRPGVHSDIHQPQCSSNI